jgi:two-component system, cell cycle sensor histidine kinase and response regulator CckA
MNTALRILHLEGDPLDAALIESSLSAAGINCAIHRVQNREDFVAALQHGGVDLILSDFTLPAFDGFSAIDIVKNQWPDLPVIIVSGTLGEERAVDSLQRGATDYVLKDHLARLGPAVRRAMQSVHDRAERRRLEVQCIESQKMEVIGQLAGGVAHDFNNILAVILGYSDMIMSGLDADNPLQKAAEEIQQAAERAAGLTRQLLVFSRKETAQPVVLNLDEVVKGLDKMLRRLIGESSNMTIVLGSAPGRVLADPGYVGQLLMNLAVNARDAMPNGGHITITTSNVSLQENSGQPHPDARNGEYVMLRVSDTGTGMTAEVQARLFEAFYTTKPKGKGTGLGLSICQTIVQQSGGHINVQSEPGRGTTFQVCFPRVEPSLGEGARTSPSEPLPCGTETLLVVEDDPAVRQLVRSVLEGRGYTVLTAANGQDGLQVVREHNGKPIRLVLTDVIMPLMSGKVMAEWLNVTDPALKVLFTSGYTDDALAHLGVLEPGIAFLPKPYTPSVLTRKVRAILDDEADTIYLRKSVVTPHSNPTGSS